MTFDEVLTQVQELLQREQRVSYRGLKRRFALDDEYLEDLKEELIGAKRLAIDEDGRFLVWTGASPVHSSEFKVQSSVQPRTVVSSQLSILSPQHPTSNTQHLAERRQLTVMFCDLVGSTALSAQLDPEELRDIVRGYQETCTRVIRRYDGHIAQHLGDGLLVYFGYPTAHEDDAARAVHTGLEIIRALRSQVPSPLVGEGQDEGALGSPHPLHVRIGIHTGVVVIGEIGSSERREMLALGETPNIAARVQGTSHPDEVIISAATSRLVEGLFATEDRGQPELKGITTPLPLYRVIKESEAQSRFAVVVRKGLTPLIGREPEFGLLRERWERVKDGTGQVVLLSGEPGIGKSRLVEALKESVEPEGARFLELRCSPYTQNSTLAPVIEHLQRTLQFQPADTTDERLHKVEQRLAPSSLDLQAVMPLFAALLSLPAPRSVLSALSPQKQKEKTHEALVAWLCNEAKEQAVTYAWEDLHWADPSTLELLTLFLAQVPTTRLLTVLTFRPEFTPPWGPHSYLSQLTLSRLGRNHVETMVARVTGDKALPPEIVRQIVSKTDGVPLFVEELTKSVVEMQRGQGIGDGEQGGKVVEAQLGIPATLQDALMARLDRLGAVKEIAQAGATIGREFTYALLRAVSPLNEETLQRGLNQLVAAELVYQSGLPPQARYLFKHALVQDTAYQSLLKSTRQQLHQSIGKVLEEQFSQTVETQPELVAHHYTAAGLITQALPYWQRAGERAVQRSASTEAISHLTKGLELLQVLPETRERDEQELSLQITLGSALMAVKGFASPETERTYNRARELCQQMGETLQLFSVLHGLCGAYTTQAKLLTARELGEQLLSLASNIQEPPPFTAAHFALGQTLFWLGEFALAREHVEQGIALYNPRQHRSYAFIHGQDPGVTCLLLAAAALWNLGYPDQARKRIREALTLAQELSHSYSLALALLYAGMLHQFCQEGPATQERVEVVMTLCSEEGFPYLSARATVLRGWALATQGEAEEGIVHIRQDMTALRTIGVEHGQSHFLTLLAEAYGKGEQTKEGLTVLAEALDFVSQTEERFDEAELYRLKGELTLQQANQKSKGKNQKSKIETDPRPLNPALQVEVESYFLKAIAIAQRQQAKSLELRAATSLARLWQQQGKSVEVHTLLSEVYNWFTEGFDTKDLQEAKALLEELRHSMIESSGH